jgi:hypothetical protein
VDEDEQGGEEADAGLQHTLLTPPRSRM